MAELTLNGNYWQLTVTDGQSCVLGIFTMPVADFVCCGTNSGWIPNPYNVCDFTPSLAPDPCTCCPPQPPIQCPPANGDPVCNSLPCCVDGCLIIVRVAGLPSTGPGECWPVGPCYDQGFTTLPDGTVCNYWPGPECFPSIDPFVPCTTDWPPVINQCDQMNGVYYLSWTSDCLWTGISSWKGTATDCGSG